ncbi:uncharacterized protein EAF02_006702 [Botrytis sinoallii]|uniref:uncharacterized protein n=1 Tax=Botrytis sinoallii TaxID=1463999 RepID=UPI0019029B80|nr:uncharacterized protein EAF02_006702 [Botrytis sinoallii]KAF7880811.1 hypothetical protein EAF02_006702 [Botrytis sinoallii]
MAAFSIEFLLISTVLQLDQPHVALLQPVAVISHILSDTHWRMKQRNRSVRRVEAKFKPRRQQ